MVPATQEDVIEHMPALRRYAEPRFPAKESAEDAIQQALAEVLGELPYLKRNQVWKRLKGLIKIYLLESRKSETRSHASIDEAPLPSAKAVDQKVERHESVQRWSHAALDAIAELPEDMRKVFTLVTLDGEQNATAARALGVSESKASRLHKQAADTLLNKLRRKGAKLRDILIVGPMVAIRDFGLRRKGTTFAFATLSVATVVTLIALSPKQHDQAVRAQGDEPTGVSAPDSRDKVDVDSTHDQNTNTNNSSDLTPGPTEGSENTEQEPPLRLVPFDHSRTLPDEFKSVPGDFSYGPQTSIQLPEVDGSLITLDTKMFLHRKGIKSISPKFNAGPLSGKVHGISRMFGDDLDAVGNEWVESETISIFGEPYESRIYDHQGRLTFLTRYLHGVADSATRYTYQNGVRTPHEMPEGSFRVIKGPPSDGKTKIIEASELPERFPHHPIPYLQSFEEFDSWVGVFADRMNTLALEGVTWKLSIDKKTKRKTMAQVNAAGLIHGLQLRFERNYLTSYQEFIEGKERPFMITFARSEAMKVSKARFFLSSGSDGRRQVHVIRED